MSLECDKTSFCRFCLKSANGAGALQAITIASLDMFKEITQRTLISKIGMSNLTCSSCKSNFAMFLNFKRRLIENQKKIIDMADQSVQNRPSRPTLKGEAEEPSPVNRLSNEGGEVGISASTIARPCPATSTQTPASSQMLKLKLSQDTGKVIVEYSDGTHRAFTINGQYPLTRKKLEASSLMVKVSTKPAPNQPTVTMKRKSTDGNATLPNLLRKKSPNAQQAPPIVESVESHEDVPKTLIKLSNSVLPGVFENLCASSSGEPPSKSK